MVMQDRRISCRQVAETLGISIERADKILTKEPGFSKVSARWVPRLLTSEQKSTRCIVFMGNLEQHYSGQMKRLREAINKKKPG